MFSGQSAQTTPSLSPKYTGLWLPINSRRNHKSQPPIPHLPHSPQSSDHHHMAQAPCPMKKATIITPQKKPWLVPGCFSSSCSFILSFAKAAMASMPWEKLWFTLSSGSSPSWLQSTPGQGAATCVSQEKPSPCQTPALAFSLCLNPALIRQCPSAWWEKSQPTLNSDSTLPSKPLGTHRVYRDMPTQGHTCKTRISNRFT